ncbi:MAG: methyltransferase [Planctomycetota bacterium]
MPTVTSSEQTCLDETATFGLGTLTIDHPPGSFAVTPASRITLEAVGRCQSHLRGKGVDWGCGSGVLTLAAARCSGVETVIGLDIEPANIATSRSNAVTNRVHNVLFLEADSFVTLATADAPMLTVHQGQFDFLIANPPASDGDDGFGFRRRVLRDARGWLKPGAACLLSISYQYGSERIDRLTAEIPGYTRESCAASTDWVPFDLSRPDLWDCLLQYVAEESRGGLPYEFVSPADSSSHPMTAAQALNHFERTGQSPLTKWQTFLFRWHGMDA